MPLISPGHHEKNKLGSLDFSKVADFLPHSGALVLLDKIIYFQELNLTAELTVRGDGLLGGDHATVPAWVGIEYMAQAIAAYIGIKTTLAGEPIKLGYLLGTRRYHTNIPYFPVNAVLTVQIENIIQDDKLGVFDCTITGGTDIHVSANLNVYQPPTDVILKTYAN